jgi:hypothetical protein
VVPSSQELCRREARICTCDFDVADVLLLDQQQVLQLEVAVHDAPAAGTAQHSGHSTVSGTAGTATAAQARQRQQRLSAGKLNLCLFVCFRTAWQRLFLHRPTA